MGDRCYMEVTCRPCDKKAFEDIGFTVTEETATYCQMEAQEVNYANYGRMPTDIPYCGHNSEGCEYEAADFCCDGVNCYDAEKNKDGDYVVRLLYPSGKVWKPDLRGVRDFIKALERVKKLFDEDPLIAQMAQAKFLAEHPGLSESKQTPGKPKQERTVKT